MRIRKFYLQNAAGVRTPLNGENGVFLSVPTGLGFTLAPSYADLKRGFFLPVSDDAEPQSNFAGTLTFFGANPYAQWQEFVNWCCAAGQLLLVYSPYAESEFFRQVDIGYFSKGEKNMVGALEVPASFTCITPWYRPQPTNLSLSTGEGVTMRFPIVFSDRLRFGSSAAAIFGGTIAAAGQTPGAILYKYYGAVSKPRIKLVGNVSGMTYGIASIDAEFDATDTLELSTVPTDSHAYKIQAGGAVIDLLDTLDVSTNPYFKIPVDEPSTISMESDVAFTGTAELLVYYYFRSV